MDISAYQHMSIRMSTRGKRPLRNLTPSDKVRAIQRIHNGETKASVSRDIGVPESTLRGWCKNEQKLRFMCRQLGAAEQLPPMQGLDNPPEKRPRFDNHIQTPKYSGASSFDEFGYNRLPLNGLNFPSNGSNAILEKIALNEIMKKHMLSADGILKQPIDNIPTQMSTAMAAPVPLSGDYSSQLSMMQNLNLLSLLSPNPSAITNRNVNQGDSLDGIKNKTALRIANDQKDTTTKNHYNDTISINSNSSSSSSSNNNNNNNQNNSISNFASLSVKNWAKDPVETNLVNLTSETANSNTVPTSNSNSIGIKRNANDSNNNNLKTKNPGFPMDGPSDGINFPSASLPLGILQIPNFNNAADSDGGNNNALLEWCKVFNASLNFLALAAAAAALQPNGTVPAGNTDKKEDNILYKELTKTTNLFDATNNPTSLNCSDVSNDSYFDSEPEDLSVRSTTTSKLSSPANSRSESPIKSNGSCSPFQSDAEH